MGNYVGHWDGGRIRETRNGPRFVIERQIDGKRVRITLESTSERQARAQLASFEEDPRGFVAHLEAKELGQAGPAILDAATVEEFLKYLRTETEARHARTEQYVRNTKGYLAWWADELGAGVDLRTVPTSRYKAILDRNKKGARLNRTAAIKTFSAFLRNEKGLPHNLDGTLGLKVPPAKPAKDGRRRGYDMGDVERLYRFVSTQVVRDLLRVVANTGMHSTEVRALAESGRIREVNLPDCEIAATLHFKHKNRSVHVQSVGEATYRAAERLKGLGTFTVERHIDKLLDLARTEAAQSGINLPRIRLGPLRHSFITWARSVGGRLVKPPASGVPLADVAEAVGHKDKRTTGKFYDETETPPMVVVPIELVHDNDPKPPLRLRRDDAVGAPAAM